LAVTTPELAAEPFKVKKRELAERAGQQRVFEVLTDRVALKVLGQIGQKLRTRACLYEETFGMKFAGL
jgi:hypothetical protein